MTLIKLLREKIESFIAAWQERMHDSDEDDFDYGIRTQDVEFPINLGRATLLESRAQSSEPPAKAEMNVNKVIDLRHAVAPVQQEHSLEDHAKLTRIAS